MFESGHRAGRAEHASADADSVAPLFPDTPCVGSPRSELPSPIAVVGNTPSETPTPGPPLATAEPGVRGTDGTDDGDGADDGDAADGDAADDDAADDDAAGTGGADDNTAGLDGTSGADDSAGACASDDADGAVPPEVSPLPRAWVDRHPVAAALEAMVPGPTLVAVLEELEAADLDGAALVEGVAAWERVAGWVVARQGRLIAEMAARQKK